MFLLGSSSDASQSDGHNEFPMVAIAKKPDCTPVKSCVVKPELLYFCSLLAEARFQMHFIYIGIQCSECAATKTSSGFLQESWKSWLLFNTPAPVLNICLIYFLFKHGMMVPPPHTPVPHRPTHDHRTQSISSHLIIPGCNPHLRTACYCSEDFVEIQFHCSFLPCSCLDHCFELNPQPRQRSTDYVQ